MIKAQEPESRPFQLEFGFQVDRPWRSVVLGTTKYERTGIAPAYGTGLILFFQKGTGGSLLKAN